jgi:RIO-like serine/threonine protein kinase
MRLEAKSQYWYCKVFDSRLDPEIQELIRQQSKSWPLVSTHSDLSSLNILIHRDNIIDIIDWETAG